MDFVDWYWILAWLIGLAYSIFWVPFAYRSYKTSRETFPMWGITQIVGCAVLLFSSGLGLSASLYELSFPRTTAVEVILAFALPFFFLFSSFIVSRLSINTDNMTNKMAIPFASLALVTFLIIVGVIFVQKDSFFHAPPFVYSENFFHTEELSYCPGDRIFITFSGRTTGQKVDIKITDYFERVDDGELVVYRYTLPPQITESTGSDREFNDVLLNSITVPDDIQPGIYKLVHIAEGIHSGLFDSFTTNEFEILLDC